MPSWPMSRRFLLAICGSLLLHALLWILVGNGSAGVRHTKNRQSSSFIYHLDFKARTPVASLSENAGVASPPVGQELSEVTSARNSLRETSTPDDGAGIGAHTIQPELVGVYSSPFYPAEQLTVRPRVVTEVELESIETRLLSASGDIVLQVFIDERGDVAGVEVEASSLPELFSRTVSNAFRNFKFTPGEVEGLVVRSVIRVEISFKDTALPN